MFGVDWENVGYAGTFVVGAVVGIIATLRLARVLAQFFTELRHRDEQTPDD